MVARSSCALAIVFAVVAAVAACDDDPSTGGTSASSSGGASSTSSSGGGTGPGTPTAANVTDFCTKRLGVVLGALEQCCSAVDKETTDYKLTHGLAALVKPQCTLALASSADAGRVLYRADRAEACYAAYASNYGPDTCANITTTFADPSGTACREAFVGTGPNGAGCLGDHECADDLTCVGYTVSDEGRCIAPPAIGEACGAAVVDGSTAGKTVLEFGTHPSCAAGATCDALTGTCVAGKPPEPPSAEGGPCASGDDCASGLSCALDTKTCAKRKPAGATCTVALLSSECAGRCDGKTGQPGTCVTFCGSK